MQFWPFEKYKKRLILLGILAWIIRSFTYIQFKLGHFMLKAYLKKNKWGNAEINSIVLFWFTLWAFALVVGKITQQIILIVIMLLNNLHLKLSFFSMKKPLKNLYRTVQLLQLYCPTSIISRHFLYANFVSVSFSYLRFLLVFVVLFNMAF